MCGLAGYVALNPSGRDVAADIATGMANQIVHRGPDGAGVWVDDSGTVALAHRRLAIVDLSAAGTQPMVSPSARFVLVFNGEIYNHMEVRRALAPDYAWRGHSDTETLLVAIEAWGLERALVACTGMFALALWDRQRGELSLARDRLGEKPLYYGWQGRYLLFGSELKALRAHPEFEHRIATAVVGDYFRFGNVPGSASIWQGIGKLPPGTYLTYRPDVTRTLPAPTPYWSIDDAVRAAHADPFRGNAKEAVDALEALLSQAVGRQMVADVPLGAFLSGGIDSSTIVAHMQAHLSTPVKTFTIGFDEEGYDESPYAAAVAAHLGTDHTTLHVSPADAQAVIPSLATIYDEPFGDASALPTMLVSQLARRHVTVALTGDGADELFAGYSRYHSRNTHRIAALAQLLPQKVSEFGLRMLAGSARPPQAGMPPFLHFYDLSMSHWWSPPVLNAGVVHRDFDIPAQAGAVEMMMLSDMHRYMPDDVLTKVDRAAMSVSLETRAPFLDHHLVEFAMRLPMDMLVRGGTGKIPLKQLLHRSVPPALLDRPKMGFGAPVDHWIRGPLRSWAEDLLSEDSLAKSGLLDVAAIRRRWQDHLSGRRNHRDPLWIALMFQSWFRGIAA